METTIGEARSGVATRGLQGQRVLITGGTRGLGLAMVKSLLARGARVTVLARRRAGLGDVERLGTDGMQGDASDTALMDGLVIGLKPAVLILNAGATPHMGSIDEQSFGSFFRGLEYRRQSGSSRRSGGAEGPDAERRSGAAAVEQRRHGAFPSGDPPGCDASFVGYIGAKRVIWLMAHNANGVAQERGLDLHFQALLPLRLVGDTCLGCTVAAAYAEREGTTVEDHLIKRYGKPLLPEQYGEDVADVVSDPRYATGVVYGFSRDTPIMALDV